MIGLAVDFNSAIFTLLTMRRGCTYHGRMKRRKFFVKQKKAPRSLGDS